MTRSNVYQKYRKYYTQKDARTMDEICAPTGADFRLQVQQEFLCDYIRNTPAWQRLLLYHKIGSGKTCTAISIAEEYMRMNPKGRVVVVLPARLRTNFYDELMTPCSNEKYISRQDALKYAASTTSQKTKSKIRREAMARINNAYDIMSFERFKKNAMKAARLDAFVNDFTQNTLIIVDEAHNLLSDDYDFKAYTKISNSGLYTRCKGSNTVIFKYLATHMHETGKLLLLTATPVFDNIKQLRELVNVMNPDVAIKNMKRLSELIETLRGRVSYFPGTSATAYPKVKYETHEIKMSKAQEEAIIDIREKPMKQESNEEKDAFMSRERQASVCLAPVSRAVKDLKEYCPKIQALIDNINTNKGKHLIYTSFIQIGVNVIRDILRAHGWIDIMELQGKVSGGGGGNQQLTKTIAARTLDQHAYKVYGIWDGHSNDATKSILKRIGNSIENVDGRLLRVIIGSPSIKEGVSIKHVQHMHLIDPVWNSSAKLQVEGRAIRFCSHSEIPKNHPFLKREVTVHIYKLIPRRVIAELTKTCDQEIYERIIPQKEAGVRAGEEALKKVAIDYYLFRDMYSDKKRGPPPKPVSNLKRSDSVISIDDDPLLTGRNKKGKKSNTCPKKRRRDEYGNCPAGYEPKYNLHGDICCYKVSRRKTGASSKNPKTPDVQNKMLADFEEAFEELKTLSISGRPLVRIKTNANASGSKNKTYKGTQLHIRTLLTIFHPDKMLPTNCAKCAKLSKNPVYPTFKTILSRILISEKEAGKEYIDENEFLHRHVNKAVKDTLEAQAGGSKRAPITGRPSHK